jgi:hypothetical protein
MPGVARPLHRSSSGSEVREDGSWLDRLQQGTISALGCPCRQCGRVPDATRRRNWQRQNRLKWRHFIPALTFRRRDAVDGLPVLELGGMNGISSMILETVSARTPRRLARKSANVTSAADE